MCFSATAGFVAGAVFAYAADTRWMISVWCFFAAVLSVIVFLHIRSMRRARG